MPSTKERLRFFGGLILSLACGLGACVTERRYSPPRYRVGEGHVYPHPLWSILEDPLHTVEVRAIRVSFDGTLVRLEDDGAPSTPWVRKRSPHPYPPSEVFLEANGRLGPGRFEQHWAALAELGFWDLPSSEDGVLLHTTSCSVEAWNPERSALHLVSRYINDRPLHEFCEAVLRDAGVEVLRTGRSAVQRLTEES